MTINLQKLGIKIKATDYVDCLEFLKAVYGEIKETDPQYSYIRFASDLGYGAVSNLYNIINDKRKLSVKAGSSIAKTLGLSQSQTKYFLQLIQLKYSKKQEEIDQLYVELLAARCRYGSCEITNDEKQLFAEWYHFVIRELISMPQVNQSPEYIANLLEPKLRPYQVEKSIQLLINTGYIEYNIRTCRLEPIKAVASTAAETEGMLFIKYHHAMIEIGKRSIGTISEDDRNISTNTLRVAKKQVELFKEKIYALQMQMLEAEPDPEETEYIYQLNFQFFPVSKALIDENQNEGEQCKDDEPKSA